MKKIFFSSTSQVSCGNDDSDSRHVPVGKPHCNAGYRFSIVGTLPTIWEELHVSRFIRKPDSRTQVNCFLFHHGNFFRYLIHLMQN